MENKANYALVGGFFTLAVAALLGFIYWFSAGDRVVVRDPYTVVFTGAVTGLAPGTRVLFNGIGVGTVTGVAIDPQDPAKVLAQIEVDSTAPVRADTAAILEVAPLTGIAHIQLLGGTAQAGAPVAAAPGQPPVLVGQASGLQTIMQNAQDIVANVDSAVTRLDRLLADNEGRVGNAIANIETVTGALAGFVGEGGSDFDVEGVLSGAVETVQAANSLVARLDALVAGNEDRLTTTLANIEVFTNALAENSGSIEHFLDTLADAGERIGPLADELQLMTADVRTLIDAIPAEDVSQTFRDVAVFTGTLADNTDNIDAFFQNAGVLASNLSDLSEGFQSTLDLIDQMSAAVDPQIIGRAMDNLDRISMAIGNNADNVDVIVTNARALVENLNASASQVNHIVGRIDEMVATEDADSLFNEIADAARAIRVLAEQLDTRTADITTGVLGFTNRGLGEYAALANEARGTLRLLDRILANVERNPQMFIFGGGQPVREFQR